MRVLRIGAKAKDLPCVILSEAKNPGFRKRAQKKQEKRKSLRGDPSTSLRMTEEQGGDRASLRGDSSSLFPSSPLRHLERKLLESKDLREAMLFLLAPTTRLAFVETAAHASPAYFKPPNHRIYSSQANNPRLCGGTIWLGIPHRINTRPDLNRDPPSMARRRDP